jgi:hypothetical protein
MIGVPQDTSEWVKARVGLVTASRLGDVMAITLPKKALCVVDPETGEILEVLGMTVREMVYEPGRPKAERANYMRELLAERRTGFAMDHYVSQAMQWGRDYEQDGKDAYEVLTGNLIEPCGFMLHPEMYKFGATPDGLLPGGGCFELKCPTSTTHLDYLMQGVVPPEYKPQMIGEMLCHQRRWCEFASFDPRFPEPQHLFIRRYEPTQAEFDEVEEAIRSFLREFDAAWERLVQCE